MTPDQAYASYARQLGDSVSIITPNGTVGPARARIVDFRPDDIVTDVQQGDRKVILLAADVVALGAAPFLRTYNLLWGDKVLTVKAVDDGTRRVGSTLIAYELQVAGA